MGLDFDAWIAKVKGGDHLDEWDLKQLCDYVKELLIEESNVQVRSAHAFPSTPPNLRGIPNADECKMRRATRFHSR